MAIPRELGRSCQRLGARLIVRGELEEVLTLASEATIRIGGSSGGIPALVTIASPVRAMGLQRRYRASRGATQRPGCAVAPM